MVPLKTVISLAAFYCYQSVRYQFLWTTLKFTPTSGKHRSFIRCTRFGLGMWPARSPDLTSLDFSWGHMKVTFCRQKSQARELSHWVMVSADHVRGSDDVIKEQQIIFWDMFWVVFVALVMEHALRMRRIVICGLPSSTVLLSVTCPALQYFSTFS